MDGTDSGIFTRHWRLLVLCIWLAAAAVLIYGQWNAIRWFTLTDTDDNLRIAQVRAWLGGQGWFDLRQYKLNPPFGADVHWSRLVDLPIAGIKLALSPLLGGARAETVAVTLAPLLPMLVAMFAIAATARRLISPKAFALGVALLLCAQSARGMWVPLRIDHHGWQLAMLSLAVMGLVDRKPARGGAIVGLATAASLTIGLEMLLYLALAGAVIGLRWVRDRDQAPRLAAYGASLAGGTASGFLLFASYANRAPVCDALSPVWLSVMAVAGALGVVLALASPASRWTRLAAALAAVALLALGYVMVWPACVGRLERASPELDQLWLSHVREALPIYGHRWRTIVSSVTLPLVGLVGYAVMLWRSRRDEPLFTLWASVATLALLAACLLLWQTRAGPAAQLLAIPGATGLAWLVIPWIQAKTNPVVRVLGTVAAFLLISGLAPQFIASKIPVAKDQGAARANINAANAKCPTMAALRPVALQPRGNVLTHVDLGPRLIAVTPHTAIAGPYHRNQADILAVMRAFRGTADAAHRTVTERKIDYVLICPNLSESTIYRADAPKGFYVQLASGKVPAWLEPVALPKDSPYRMWRVRR
jgi:hypothetical protein